MTHYTLAAWKQNIAVRLVSNVPTLTIADGTTLAESYLSSTGGWIPDNPGEPTDLGEPASGLYDYQVVAEILSQITSSQYEFSATVTLPVTFRVYANLSPGLDDAQVRDAVASQVREYLTRTVAHLPIGIDPSTLVYTSIDSQVVGSTTSTQRQSFQAGTTLTPVPILSNTLIDLRDRYDLDEKWNIISVFVSPTGGSGETFVDARKFTDTTYTVYDSAETTHIMALINADTGIILTGTRNRLG